MQIAGVRRWLSHPPKPRCLPGISRPYLGPDRTTDGRMKVKRPGTRFRTVLGAFRRSDRSRAFAGGAQIGSWGVGLGRSLLDGRDLPGFRARGSAPGGCRRPGGRSRGALGCDWARADDVSEAQTSGACGLPRGFALRGRLRCAPRCHARARLRWSGCVPVVDRAAVGGFGLQGERALGVADVVVASAGARANLSFARRGAGRELELADLATRQRRLPEGVVLLAREQTPEQAGELARRGDRGDLGAAARADALIEGAQRAGRADGDPRGLDEDVTDRG